MSDDWVERAERGIRTALFGTDSEVRTALSTREFDNWHEDAAGMSVRVRKFGGQVIIHVSPEVANSYTYLIRVQDGVLVVDHAPEPARGDR